MEAGKHTVKQLFQRDIRYVIPTFQRPYVWTQDQQWDPLWEDVRNISERFAEELSKTPDNVNLAESNTGTHFLGAVVLQQIPTTTSEIERRDVIDGQQRMTTLQLLLGAAREVLEAEGHTQAARRLQKLVLNDEDFAVADERFKLWPTATDQEVFRAVMVDGQYVSDHGASLIVRAHRYFREQIHHWLTTAADSGRYAEALLTALSGLLELVVIDLKSADDAYVIFETLNARGTPLLASDLIKNFMMHTAASEGIETESFHRRYWLKFEDDWWRNEERQGRIFRPRIDIFLNYWLAARIRDEVPSQRVFPVFREYVTGSSTGLERIADDIRKNGETFRGFESLAPATPEGTFLYRWNTIEAGVITPVLLDLFARSGNSVAEGEARRLCLSAIESFLIRRMVCRATSKDYNRLFAEMLARMDQVGNVANVVVTFLAEQTADSRLWPSDDDFRQALVELPLYRMLTRARLRVILEAIEEHLRTDKAEDASVVRNKLTIEHVLPQTWQTYWPLATDDDPEVHHRNVGIRDRLKHTVGNLTLVHKKLNPALSNGPWQEKKAGLNMHSTLFLNKRLLSDFGEGPWGEAQILKRGDQLADVAIAVWPSGTVFAERV